MYTLFVGIYENNGTAKLASLDRMVYQSCLIFSCFCGHNDDSNQSMKTLVSYLSVTFHLNFLSHWFDLFISD